MVLFVLDARLSSLSQDRQNPSDVLAHDLELVRVFQFFCDRLSAKVEQMPADAIQFRVQIRRLQFSKFGDLHDIIIQPDPAIGYKP